MFSSPIGSLIVVICLVAVVRWIASKRKSEERSAFRLFCSRIKFWIGEGRENALAGKIVRTLLTVVSPFTHVRGDGMGGQVRRGGDEHPLDRNIP
jgi:hypothetical protein